MKLIRPSWRYVGSYLAAICEEKRYRPDAEPYYTNPWNIVSRSRKEEAGLNLKPGWVPATTFWLVDDRKFIGTISIRHELTPFLRSFGGHIGYGIRYSECNKGYGTMLLGMVLGYCRDVLKLQRVLVTCDDDNPASARVIEKNGGVLEDKVVNKISRGIVLTRRYWIEL